MYAYDESQLIVHYGIKGQKWGVRRWQNEDGTFNEAGKRKYFGQGYYNSKSNRWNNKADKAQRMADMNRRASETGPKILSGIYKSNERYYQAEADKFRNRSNRAKQKANAIIARNSNKELSKIRYNEQIKEAVKKYQAAYDRASEASDRADAMADAARLMRKGLGKNNLTRTIRAARNKTSEAKAYNKAMDEATDALDRADELWVEANRLRKDTGRNRISRTINNIKYDSNRR